MAAVTTAVTVGAGLSTAATVAVGALAVGTAASIYSSRKARKAAQRSAEIGEKRAQLQSMRQSVQQIRASQIAAADIRQMGVNQDVGGSSGVAGGIYSLASQAAGNIKFAQDIFSLQRDANQEMQRAQRWQWNGQAISAIANATATFAQYGAFDAPKNSGNGLI